MRILFVVTEDWYFLSHRLPSARAAASLGLDIVVATHVDQMAQRIRALGYEVVDLGDIRTKRGFFHHLDLIRRLVQVLRATRPDIVHNVALEMCVLGTVAAMLAGMPCVINTVAGLGWIARTVRGKLVFLGIASLFWLSSWRKAYLFVCQNQDDLSLFKRFVRRTENIVKVIGSGVDVSKFQTTPLPEEAAPLVACVARLLVSKGIYDLVEAARILKDKGVKCRIALIGGSDFGNPDGVPEDLLRQWNARKEIEWWGERSDIETIWKEATIAVLPSYREGLPKSLLEAAACGRPLIATDVPGCRELVLPEVNGLLVALRDPVALASAIERLVGDRGLCQRMGTASRTMVETKCSDEHVTAAMRQVYQRALAAAGKPLLPSAP
ncbi:MAG: glycosyltransferase family 4 protein [Alphaproteobacteria bacterium]|nr:glycosyltransferase family 4 protein [Alphaproteobacteria bacterium]